MDKTICEECGQWCDTDSVGNPHNHTCAPVEPPKPEACFFCRFYSDFGQRSIGSSTGRCRRYPKMVTKTETEWCGEFQRNPAAPSEIPPLPKSLRERTEEHWLQEERKNGY